MTDKEINKKIQDMVKSVKTSNKKILTFVKKKECQAASLTPSTLELVTDDDTYFLPKYIELANASDCECALNSGIQEKMQTLYKYCNSGDASADTAYAEYIHLLKTGEEPCENLRKYVKRMSKSIASRLIATGRNSEAVYWWY